MNRAHLLLAAAALAVLQAFPSTAAGGADVVTLLSEGFESGLPSGWQAAGDVSFHGGCGVSGGSRAAVLRSGAVLATPPLDASGASQVVVHYRLAAGGRCEGPAPEGVFTSRNSRVLPDAPAEGSVVAVPTGDDWRTHGAGNPGRPGPLKEPALVEHSFVAPGEDLARGLRIRFDVATYFGAGVWVLDDVRVDAAQPPGADLRIVTPSAHAWTYGHVGGAQGRPALPLDLLSTANQPAAVAGTVPVQVQLVGAAATTLQAAFQGRQIALTPDARTGWYKGLLYTGDLLPGVPSELRVSGGGLSRGTLVTVAASHLGLWDNENLGPRCLLLNNCIDLGEDPYGFPTLGVDGPADSAAQVPRGGILQPVTDAVEPGDWSWYTAADLQLSHRAATITYVFQRQATGSVLAYFTVDTDDGDRVECSADQTGAWKGLVKIDGVGAVGFGRCNLVAGEGGRLEASFDWGLVAPALERELQEQLHQDFPVLSGRGSFPFPIEMFNCRMVELFDGALLRTDGPCIQRSVQNTEEHLVEWLL